MGYPNNNCGECGYWLAFCEPETTDEQNEEIIEHCKHCTYPCGVVDENYMRIINNARLQLHIRNMLHGGKHANDC
jgi:hypothetical protein